MNQIAQNLITDLDSALSPALKDVIGGGGPPSASLPSFETLTAPIDPQPLEAPRGPLRHRAAPQAGNGSVRSLQRFGAIGKTFPGAERLRVRKYDDVQGLWGPVGDWPLAAVKNSKDIEGWLLEFIRPQYKTGGRFQVSLFDADGRETPAGEFVLPSPPVDAAGPATDSVALRVLDTLERKMNQQPPVAVDPIAAFRQVNHIVEEARTRAGSGQSDLASVLGTMIQAQQAQAQAQASLQLQMMQQAQAQQTEMMRLLVTVQQGSLAAAPPPPPPMAPAATENPMMMRFMEVAMPLLVERLLKPELSTKEVIAMLTNRPERSELETMRTAVDFLRSVQGNEKKESLVDEMTKMAQIRQFASELVGGEANNAGGSSSNFWDAVAQLFSNKDFAGSLGKMIGSDIQQRREAPRPPAQVPQLPAGPRPAAALPQQTVVHNPVPITVAQPPAQAAPPPGTRTIAGDKLIVVGPNGQRLVLPANMQTLTDSIAASTAPEECIQRTAEVLYRLRDLETWRPFVDAVLEHSVKNEKQPALQALKGWLGLLVQLSFLSLEAAKAVLAAFDEHWISFHTSIATLMGATPAAVAAPAAAPVDAAPAVVEAAAPDGEHAAPDGEDEAGPADEDEDE